MAVCETPLYWEEVPCDIYDTKEDEPTGVDNAAEEAAGRGGMPLWIVIPVQVLSAIWELHIVYLVTLPWWGLLVGIAAADWVLDWVWLGLFFWCKRCAGFFIWLVNIALLPFHVFGWLMRFRLETYGAIVDGWMLFVKGSGCYLRYGKHCWFTKKWKDRNLRTYWDIPILSNGEGIKSLFTPPQLTHYSEVRQVGASKRQILFDLMPHPVQAVESLIDTFVEL